MRERAHDWTLEIQRLIALVGQNSTDILAATAVLVPFDGAGTGDGIVGDPGGTAVGHFLRDDGNFHAVRSSEVLMASCQDTQAALDANLINSAMPSIPIPLSDYSGTDWVYSS